MRLEGTCFGRTTPQSSRPGRGVARPGRYEHDANSGVGCWAQDRASVVARKPAKADGAKGVIRFNTALGRLGQAEQKMTIGGNLTLSIGGTGVDAEVKQDVSTRTRIMEKKK